MPSLLGQSEGQLNGCQARTISLDGHASGNARPAGANWTETCLLLPVAGRSQQIKMNLAMKTTALKMAWIQKQLVMTHPSTDDIF